MMNTLQTRISQMLELRGLSQNEVSRRAGASLGLVRDIVSGKVKSPRWESIVLIADALAVSPEYLTGRIDDYWPPARQVVGRELPVVGLVVRSVYQDPARTIEEKVDVVDTEGTVAYRVDDDSALGVCPTRGYAICARFADARRTPRDKEFVVVEIPMAGTNLIERRIMRYTLVSGEVVLQAASPGDRGIKLEPSMSIPAFVTSSVWRP